MSSSLIVISLVSCKKTLLVRASAVRHSTPTLEAILTKAFMAIFRSIAVSFNWSNKFLNCELFYKVVMVAASNDGLSSLSSLESA